MLWINHHGARALSTRIKLFNEDNFQRITGMKVNLDIMLLYTCFIDFGVNSNLMIDSMQARQLLGQEEWKNHRPMPYMEFETAANKPETGS